jgi:hypothetical protein
MPKPEATIVCQDAIKPSQDSCLSVRGRVTSINAMAGKVIIALMIAIIKEIHTAEVGIIVERTPVE